MTNVVLSSSNRFLRIAEASIYVPEKGKNAGVECLSLTFLNYGKKSWLQIPLTDAKKHFKLGENFEKSQVNNVNRPNIEVVTEYTLKI